MTKSVPVSSIPSSIFTSIRKRNGKVVSFDAEKITYAITKAGLATGEYGEAEAHRLSVRVLTLAQALHKSESPDVEEIQDLVEEVLLTSPYKKSAKAYILYRDQHSRIRQAIENSETERVNTYLEKLDWQVDENSNMAYSLQGLNNYIAGEVSRNYWLTEVYSQEVREAHTSGDLHIHDLGQLSVYCVGWDLQDLLRMGFRGVSGKAESGPARHFRSALGQIVNFFYTLQGEAAGAQAFSGFDTFLAPFIRHDNLDYKEVKQAIQEFIFNLNVPTRVGFQTPFTNLTMDLQPPKNLRDQPVLIGGELQEETYGEFQKEMTMINQAFLEIMSAGDAKSRVFTFPIPTYTIGADFNWDDPGIDQLWQVTGRYGIPYFANYVNSDLSPDDARSMCCRLRLDTRSLERRGGGLFGAYPLTGSIGVVTVNLTAIGYQAESEEEFFNLLDHRMEIAKSSLEVKRKLLENLTQKGLYPYTRFYLRQVFERYKRYWDNHFSTIGLIGGNEACLNLLGKTINDKQGRDFLARVLDHMRDKLQEFQEQTGNLYNLEATPAEGTGYRLARLDRKRFPDLKCSLQTNDSHKTPIYSNSTQLPVNHSDDILEVLDQQDPLQAKYTGGTVQHIYLGEAAPDAGAVKQFVKHVCSNYRLPYFTLTPSFSICPEHGYLAGEQSSCPTCEEKTEIYSRVVGYLRPVQQWNVGKKAEFEERANFQLRVE